MYKNLVLYRNELKNKLVPKYKLIGIVSELLLSKEIFKKNSDISNFLKQVFDIEYKEYVMKSRTMIMARTNRIICTYSDDLYPIIKTKLYDFINEEIDVFKQNGNLKSDKNELDGWM